MTKASYEKIRKLCSGVFCEKQTLPVASAWQFVPVTMLNCDLSTPLLFTEYYSSLCVQTFETRAKYSLRRLLSINQMNADIFKLLS